MSQSASKMTCSYVTVDSVEAALAAVRFVDLEGDVFSQESWHVYFLLLASKIDYIQIRPNL